MTIGTTNKYEGRFRLPDPPDREQDEAAANFDHLAVNGNVRYLALHFGNPETTLVAGEHYLTPAPTGDMRGLKYPDLLVAFDVDPSAYYRSNSYVISEQGKPPDFVLEIASRSTGRNDVVDKREAYAALGIPEYWRFDETGEYHGTRLAGDHLVDGRYVPIPIEELEEGILQGYSPVLNLNLRWEEGRLGWYDPATGRHITTFDDQRTQINSEREARIQSEARADREQEARLQSDARAGREREARIQSEARADREREARLQLEAELRRLRGG